MLVTVTLSQCCIVQANPDRLEQREKYETAKEKAAEKLKRIGLKMVIYPPIPRPTNWLCLEMVEKFSSMRDGHLSLLHASKHRIELLNDEVRPVHSTLYRVGTTARQFTAVEKTRIVSKNVIEPALTK